MCKHFGLSLRDVDEWLTWPDWICCVAVAQDLEELERYEQFLLAGGERKRWKWSSPDHAGTRQQRQSTFRQIMSLSAEAKMKPHKGDIDQYAQVRGLQKVFKLPDGTFVDEDGRPVRAADKMFVPSQRGSD